MLRIVMEEMDEGEIAAMYQEGEDAVILVARHLPDDVRCAAVNRLLASVKAARPPRLRIASVAILVGFLLAHLSEQMTGAASQGLQALLV